MKPLTVKLPTNEHGRGRPKRAPRLEDNDDIGLEYPSDTAARDIAAVLRRSNVPQYTTRTPFAVALRSRMEFHPRRNVRLTLTISSNELGSRLPLKPSFGPGGLRTCNVFFQKTAGLL